MSTDAELPMGWIWATLDDLIGSTGEFCDGDWIESEDQDPEGDVRLIQLADVGDGQFKDKSRRFLTSAKAKELNCTFISAGDVLIARMPDPLGRAAIFPGDAKPSVTAVDVCIVRSGEPGVDHRWLMWFVNAPSFRSGVAALQSGSTRKRISRKNLATVKLPVPPLAEQWRIVAKIEELFADLDAGVAALERVRAKLKRYRAAVLRAAVEGRLTADWRAAHPATEPASALLDRILADRRAKWEADQRAKFAASGKPPPKNWQAKYPEPTPPDTTNLPPLPDGWCWTRLSQVAEFQNGRAFPSAEYSEEGVKLLRPGNLYVDGSVGWTTKSTRRLPENWADEFPDYLIGGNELLMNLTAQSLKDEFLGRTCLTSADERCLLNQRIARISPLHGFDPKYALLLLKSALFRRFVNQLNTGSLIQHMFTSQLDEFVFPLPPLAEQEQTVMQVEERLSQVAAAERAVAANLIRAARLRQAILKRAFAGQLVSQDPADEPAAELLRRIRAAQPPESKRSRRGTRLATGSEE